MINYSTEQLATKEKSALSLAYKVIDNEWYILEEHSDKTIYENRHQHFVEYYKYILNKHSESTHIDFFAFVQEQYGQDYIMNVFAKDSRSLEELMADIGNKHEEAKAYVENTTHSKGIEARVKKSSGKLEQNAEIIGQMDKVVNLHLEGFLTDEEAKSKLAELKKLLP